MDGFTAVFVEDVDPPSREAPVGGVVAFGDDAAEGIGSTFRGWNFCACDLNFPLSSDGGEPAGTSGDPSGGAVIRV